MAFWRARAVSPAILGRLLSRFAATDAAAVTRRTFSTAQSAKLVRAPGTCAMILKEPTEKGCLVRLPSGVEKWIDSKCSAVIGEVPSKGKKPKKLYKAGQSRWIGIRPTVRGVAMNPCDHPHGGGEGKSKSSGSHVKCFRTPWGKPCKGGYKTGPNKHIIPSVESIDAENKVIPSLSVMRQLATAIEAGKKCKSMKDFLGPSVNSSPGREMGGLSLSAVKSLVIREKDIKLSDFGRNKKFISLINSLFDEGRRIHEIFAEGNFLRRKITSGSDLITAASMPKNIHGAPPESLFVKLAEVIGSFRTLKKMMRFWCSVFSEFRRLWYEEAYVPSIPVDEIPDLNSCLLYQQLQVINCCVSRKRRRQIATDKLDYVIGEVSPNTDKSSIPADDNAGPVLYAQISTGELVLRLGVDRPVSNLKMLETGELIYSPVTQEAPLLTEEVIKETEEFVLRTGSVGAGCSQLLSDMQAFKAANPGCVLEDFVRWHSPPDWTEGKPVIEAKSLEGNDVSSTKGQLSSRMQKEGNIWRELWGTAKPVPAVRQVPLFDEDLTVEHILDGFEDISPSKLFEQLFISLLGLGFLIAETKLSDNSSFSKLFYECKDFVVSTCRGKMWTEKVVEICQVFETVETMIVNPEEDLRLMKQPEEVMT